MPMRSDLAEPERGVVARGAPQHEEPEQRHRDEPGQQHAVETERAQQPRHAGDRALGARVAEFAVDHFGGSATR